MKRGPGGTRRVEWARSTKLRILLAFVTLFFGLVTMSAKGSLDAPPHLSHHSKAVLLQAPRRFLKHTDLAVTLVPPQTIHDVEDGRWLLAVLHPSAGWRHSSTRFWGWLPAPPI